MVQHPVTLLCLFFILLGSAGLVLADTEADAGENSSHVIFSFSAASPVEEDLINFTLNKTSQYSKNESVEAYYNNISEEADTSLPKLVLLGIPMECHFCLIVPAIKLTE